MQSKVILLLVVTIVTYLHFIDGSVNIFNESHLAAKFIHTTADASREKLSTDVMCCLPNKSAYSGTTVNVGFSTQGNITYYSNFKVHTDLDKKLSSYESHSSDGTQTFSKTLAIFDDPYTYVYEIRESKCDCTKSLKFKWSAACVKGELLAKSNIGDLPAMLIGKNIVSPDYKKVAVDALWTVTSSNGDCWPVSRDYTIIEPGKSYLTEPSQFYGHTTDVDPSIFAIPAICPSKELCVASPN